MRTRTYGGVGGRKTKVGGKLTFVFLLPDWEIPGQAGDDVEELAGDSWRTGFQSSSFNLDWDTGVP